MPPARVVLIDLSSLWWTAWMVNHENGIQMARTITLANVKRCIGEGDPLVAICCDSGESFRKELSAEYKANREKQPEAAYGELLKTRERLAADGYLLWEAPTFEADDIIATACKLARDRGHEVRVCSADKDLMQLVGPGVDVLRTHVWEVWDGRTVTEKIGVDSSQLGDYLALTGDASDNIPGCPGIGKVRASELLTKFETLDKLYGVLDVVGASGAVSTPAIEKALRDNRSAVELSRKLVALRYDVPIDFEALYAERKPAELEPLEAKEFDEATAQAVPVDLDAERSPPGALVPYEFTQQLEPRSFKDLVIGCKILYNARIYQKYPGYEAMVGAALRGREMGYGLGASLDIFHVMDVKGVRSLALHAHVIIDRAMRDPDCEYIECVETTHEKATYEFKRKSRPEPFRLTYTIEQARSAHLIKPGGNWELRPAEQLRKTCGVQGSRVVFPGAAMGLYCLVEMGADE